MVLLFLMKSGAYKSNDGLIYSLLELIGHCVSWDALAKDYSWLEEQHLVKLEKTEFGIVAITLTRTGGDVAMGRQILPGVRRPYPEEIERWRLEIVG